MQPRLFKKTMILLHTLCVLRIIGGSANAAVDLFTPFEMELKSSGAYTNPYLEVEAYAAITDPRGVESCGAYLFWDGGDRWKFRFAPTETGRWRWRITSKDPGLNGKSGEFECVASARKGSIRPMPNFPRHFQRQDGSPFWFFGDTAWALFTDSAKEKHDRAAVERYIDTRASQGFNVLHSMLLSEAGWGNRGGMPFENLSAERINSAYWREVDERVAYANRKGIVCGLVLAWGDKGRDEPFAWSKFPGVQARQRYARYIAARYGAFDVYFIVSGEWHAEVTARQSTEEKIKSEFIRGIGEALRDRLSNDRMITIHPMTEHGSVREFNEAPWMHFGDYQQNYDHLHARILESLRFNKPVVNSEYGYHLRDQSGDGVPDKENSTSVDTIRHATWDIVMAGGYVVTGFGTTYFGGNRDPGPFDIDAERNDDWEKQIAVVKDVFTSVEWWKLNPNDELLSCTTARGKDRQELKRVAPPKATYWCLADPGREYLVYGRGLKEPVTLRLAIGGISTWKLREINPMTGESKEKEQQIENETFLYRPPSEADWIFILSRR